ncbi:TRAP transporter TatT component family protein [Pseudomonas aeruginosa]|uniref:TRAP transporter TatT component family protein n=1 Tax=Pseudomonas aeruginosa TaxID=287 RepID=UPI00214DA418|nr:TRAP transporter TatT component family protein [Pseudomonas aeruginosa]MCR3807318.1 TRAP transporter TatT component family protein [Pseudomonas aeruginosa]MCW4649229.1 TRAP transporter TatT component family protein [Pseudomonas aeruginosa]
MDMYRKFAIRKAEMTEASISEVSANLSSNLVSVRILEDQDKRSTMQMFLYQKEAASFHKKLGDALAAISGEPTAVEQLEWVLEHNPEFNDGSLTILLGPLAAQRAGFGTRGGPYIAKGATRKACIVSAMKGQLTFIG